MGSLLLIVASLFRSKPAQILALVCILVTAGLCAVAFETGEDSYDRVTAMSDNTGQKWLENHMKRAEKGIYFFYATGVVSLAALFLTWKSKRGAAALVVATLIMSLASCRVAAWISYAGGKIRHPEFRDGPP